jgi:cystine transport system ATP-binding protein
MNLPIEPGMVEVAGLSKRFGDKTVLHDISLSVPKGQVLVVMGPSGSGKTTFIRCLNLLEIPDAGRLTVCGTDLTMQGRRPDWRAHRKIVDIRRRTAMVFQAFNLFAHMTALENVIEGLVSVKRHRRSDAQVRGLELLGKVGLLDKANSYPSHLSGGQKQRVAIARALSMDPELILFDEPTSALDPELRDDVLCVMRELADEGMTMLVVTHEVRFARDVADRVLFMEGGRILEDCEPSTFFGMHASERVRQFLGRLQE